MCELEVRADVVNESFVVVERGRYRFRLQPALDVADRRQLTGCLQDLRIDHVLANVVSMDDIDPENDEPDDDDDDDDDGAGADGEG